jgi:ketosteroid isomerase-like protein
MDKDAINDEQVVLNAAREYEDAWLHADIPVLERILDDAFTYTSPAAQISTKEEDLANLKSGNLKYHNLIVDKAEARLYGDAAVVMRETSVTGEIKGQAFSGRFRGTGFWIKRGDKWQIVAFHASEIRA